MVFGCVRPVIVSTVSVAHGLSTRPLIGLCATEHTDTTNCAKVKGSNKSLFIDCNYINNAHGAGTVVFCVTNC